MTARSKWIWPANRPLVRAAARAGSLASLFGSKAMEVTSTSISGPTNGRADDQIRRNHSTQYSSHPNFDFAQSRQEAPEKYESYVDLQPGVWTKYKIEVEGRKARLYVHGAEQPCLIVNDLKLDPRSGGVALWVGPGTEGYFSNLKITAK
jgi:hypothetical protein